MKYHPKRNLQPLYPAEKTDYGEMLKKIKEYGINAEPTVWQYDTEKYRHDKFIEILFWCLKMYNTPVVLNRIRSQSYFNSKIDKEIYYAYDIARQNIGNSSNSKPEYKLTPMDWGQLLSEVTLKYSKEFVVLNMTDDTYLGGDLTGSHELDEDVFRRSDCFFNLLDADIKTREYKKKLTVHIENRPRLYLRDSNYENLNRGSVLPFIEMRCSKNLTYELVEQQFNLLFENSNRTHVIFFGFDCIDYGHASIVAEWYKLHLSNSDFFVAVYFSIKNPIIYSIFQKALSSIDFVCEDAPTDTYDCPRTFVGNMNYVRKTLQPVTNTLRPVTNTLYQYGINAPYRLAQGITYPFYSSSKYANTKRNHYTQQPHLSYGRARGGKRRGGKRKTRRPKTKWNKTFKKK